MNAELMHGRSFFFCVLPKPSAVLYGYGVLVSDASCIPSSMACSKASPWLLSNLAIFLSIKSATNHLSSQPHLRFQLTHYWMENESLPWPVAVRSYLMEDILHS
mmetsp:Transcript_17589/g.31741  ORF Transcript_17589/g.31741 Transcript_17589/m.31741 type:complete len:104 (+) Transcript_17589:95-406(+)